MSRHVLTLEELSRERWATCGPASLAALLGRPLAEIRGAFPRQTPERTWTNQQDMVEAFRRLGLLVFSTGASGEAHPPEATGGTSGAIWPIQRWPVCGLAMVQFRGGWEKAGAPLAAALEHTHWVAVQPALNVEPATPAVFDVNQVGDDYFGLTGWTFRSSWEQRTVPMLAASYGLQRDKRTPRAMGAFWVRAGFEVELPATD